MKLTFLGTGTSIGVPAIGCACAVCRSTDPRDKRRRAALYLQTSNLHLVVDTPPDFREQVLTFNVPRLDVLLITHGHTDHLMGFDDIRRFNIVQKQTIPVYGPPLALDAITRIFPYIKKEAPPGLAYPRVALQPVSTAFAFGGIKITPIPVQHADLPTFGYRFDAAGKSIAYVPDCQTMPDESASLLHHLDVMILDALRVEEHPTHLSFSESADLLRRIGARASYVTHLGHQLGHTRLQAMLAPDIIVPYDGLTMTV